MDSSIAPEVFDSEAVGSYPKWVKSGGGYVWDEVLEYRVWSYPHEGAPDEENGDDYFQPFATLVDAESFASGRTGAHAPLALVLQREYIDEPSPGDFRHVREERVAEWLPEWLATPRRSATTLAGFFAADAPPNRLDILRGTA